MNASPSPRLNAPEALRMIREEMVNSLTHGLGLVLSAAGAAILLVLASLFGNVWHIVSCSIYGGSLLFLYTASTLYHSARSERLKQIMRLLDHVGIFLLIAGTYTPFALVWMRDGWGWTLFGVVWGLAVLGILFKIFSTNRFRNLSTIFYLLLGWMSVLFIKPMLAAIPEGALFWIVAGGLFYTLGVIFYAWPRLPYSHAIWHLFVLGGSTCHYFAVLFYVLP